MRRKWVNGQPPRESTSAGCRSRGLGVVIAGLHLLLLLTASCRCAKEPAKGTAPGQETQLPLADSPWLATAAGFRLDTATAYRDLARLTEAPHPFGSPKQAAIGDYLLHRSESDGLAAFAQRFMATVPLRDPPEGGPYATTADGRNILAFPRNLTGNAQGSGNNQAPCVVLIGSHYDTKDLPGQKYVGANDSGSSSIALLQVMAYLGKTPPERKDDDDCAIAGIWFDGEEAVLDNWDNGLSHPARQQDNTYGSRHFTSQLVDCPASGGTPNPWNGKPSLCLPDEFLSVPPPGLPVKAGAEVRALVLMDLIGSEPFIITDDSLTTPRLRDLLLAAAQGLGLGRPLSATRREIADDHVPFLDRGIPSVNLINFENITHWHRETDVTETLSLESIEKTSRIAVFLAKSLAAAP